MRSQLVRSAGELGTHPKWWLVSEGSLVEDCDFLKNVIGL